MACFRFDGAKIRNAVLTRRTPISRTGYNGHKKEPAHVVTTQTGQNSKDKL